MMRRAALRNLRPAVAVLLQRLVVEPEKDAVDVTLGLVLAQWAVSTFVQLAGTTLPRASSVRIDATVVGFALLISLVTGVVCGLW